jgi:hypothetical protein
MSTTERSRTAYFNVPASEQPLRVRQPDRKPDRKPEREPEHSVLEELVIAPTIYGHDPTLADEDRQESKDAFWECAHGRLPHDSTPPCGCWPQEPAPVPDLIPAWVLADARDLHAQGMTVRRIARMILPATGCADVPSCEQLLKLQLESQEVQ